MGWDGMGMGMGMYGSVSKLYKFISRYDLVFLNVTILTCYKNIPRDIHFIIPFFEPDYTSIIPFVFPLHLYPYGLQQFGNSKCHLAVSPLHLIHSLFLVPSADDKVIDETESLQHSQHKLVRRGEHGAQLHEKNVQVKGVLTPGNTPFVHTHTP